MYTPEENNHEKIDYKETMRNFYLKRYTSEISDDFDGGYYVNILEDGHVKSTLTVYGKDVGYAEQEALKRYVKQKHGY